MAAGRAAVRAAEPEPWYRQPGPLAALIAGIAAVVLGIIALVVWTGDDGDDTISTETLPTVATIPTTLPPTTLPPTTPPRRRRLRRAVDDHLVDVDDDDDDHGRADDDDRPDDDGRADDDRRADHDGRADDDGDAAAVPPSQAILDVIAGQRRPARRSSRRCSPAPVSTTERARRRNALHRAGADATMPSTSTRAISACDDAGLPRSRSLLLATCVRVNLTIRQIFSWPDSSSRRSDELVTVSPNGRRSGRRPRRMRRVRRRRRRTGCCRSSIRSSSSA